MVCRFVNIFDLWHNSVYVGVFMGGLYSKE